MSDFKVILLAAVTADGFIGRSAEHLADWSSPEDKRHFVAVTKQCGALVMGARTFATIGRALPGRRNIMYTRHAAESGLPDVETTDLPPAELIRQLQQDGVPGLAVCGGASIYGLFLAAGVVNELQLTIEPMLFGQGLSLFDRRLEQRLELVAHETLNKHSIRLTYHVI